MIHPEIGEMVSRPFRKVALISGIGAAGLLAYRMYAAYGTEATWRYWWLPQSCSFLPSSWLDYFTAMHSSDNAADERDALLQQAESDKLARHFDMTVTNADDYYPELMESVVTKLFQVDGLEEILRAAYEGTSPPKQDAIKQASFTRFIMAMWCIPTTFLLCRLVFCIFGRIIYLSMAAENIHKNRRRTYLEREQCPPMFDIAYQRRLLRTFRSIVPETISRTFYPLVSRVVSKHLTEIPCGQFTTLQALNILLSTINTEIESKISAQEGNFWKTLLGDDALLHSLGLGTRDDMNEQTAYVQDILREARQSTATKTWHIHLVDTVKLFVQKQTVFINDTYASVLDEIRNPKQVSEDETTDDDSLYEDGTEVYETESSAFRRPAQEGTVDYDDGASEASDKSAYDVGVYSREQRRATPDRTSPTQGRTRLAAEGSLEPLELSDADHPSGQSDVVSGFFSDGDEKKQIPSWEANDSEMDTGEHQSFECSLSPPPGGRRVQLPPQRRSSPQTNRQHYSPQLLPEGIPFFRWATKLGRQGEDLLNEPTDFAKELKTLPVVHDYCLDIFASSSVTSLPRCQLESALHMHRRC